MSKEEEFRLALKKLFHQLMLIICLFFIVGLFLLHYTYDPYYYRFDTEEQDEYTSLSMSPEEMVFKDGIEINTGFKEAEGLTTVINNCTNCHSSKLVIQNRMSRERWNALIRWMQETQNLWDLGDNQKIIVDYLVENYPVENMGRRANLTDIEWYELED